MTEENTELEQILNDWQKDSPIDITAISEEVARIPTLHAKYLRYYSKHSILAKKAGGELAKVKKFKWRFYNGKVDEEELKKMGIDPFPYILKADSDKYVDGDAHVLAVQKVLQYHQEVVKVCEYIMKEISQRSYQLKTVLDGQKFFSGG